MLNELHIENIAVIERADISFGRGLNVLTGETGAGKSIVIDSIGAVLGDRVSRELVRRGADKGLVTAAFDVGGCEQWLADNEIEADDDLIIQRSRREKQLPYLRCARHSGAAQGAGGAACGYPRAKRRTPAHG